MEESPECYPDDFRPATDVVNGSVVQLLSGT
jgi:hypothetical protein